MNHRILILMIIPILLINVPVQMICCAAIAEECISNESSWIQTNGPAGGIITTIEIDPQNPDVLYAAGAGCIIFKSTDSGASWKALEQLGMWGEEIADILIFPNDPRTVLVLDRTCNLFKSADGGENWKHLDIEPRFRCVALNLENPLSLIGGTIDGRVFRSFDAGNTWKDISGNLPGEFIGDVAIGAKNEFWVGIANRKDGHVYHTKNGGLFWQRMEIGQPEDTDICSIFVDPENSDIVYVGLTNVYNEPPKDQEACYLFKTEDGGKSWMDLPFPTGTIKVMDRSVANNALYVSIGGRVFKSMDGGWIWTCIGPHRACGDIYDIAIDPKDCDILYLPIRSHGILKSADGGASWKPANEGLLNVGVPLLAVAPVNGTVYAAGSKGEGTFKTTDHGDSWTYLNDGGIMHPWTDELVVSPHDSETVWEVADIAQVFRTTDGGSNWDLIINPCEEGFRYGSVYALAPAPCDPRIIYALKSGFGIFKSDNRGEDWRFLHQSEIDYTYSIAVHPHDSDIVYSGYIPKPFQDWAMVRRSTDGGDSWDTSLQVEGSKGITSVVIDPKDPDVIYAGSIGEGQIYRSTDEGVSWSKLNQHFKMCTVWGQPQLIVHPTNSSIAYAATWLGGTWKTEDAGKSWKLLESAPISATALSINMENTEIIYLADRSSPTVWKSNDSGSSWEKVVDFSDDGALLVMRVYANGNTLYASTFHPCLLGGKLYRSTDAGDTWTDITGALPKGVLDVEVDPENSDNIYVTTNIYGVYKSTDGGETWMSLENFPFVGVYDIEVDPVKPSILYASARGGSLPSWFTEIAGIPHDIQFTDDAGVYKSTDYGDTWSKILVTSASCRAVRVHPDNHEVLLAVDLVDGLKVSTDGGKSWKGQNAGLDTMVLTSCAVNEDKIYVGTQGCGVYSGDFSINDGSVIWQPERSNKPVPEVFSMQIKIDPANSDCIFVASYPGGLFCSTDGGKTFRDKNGITPSVVVDDPFRQGYYTFAFNPANTSEMWLGTWGRGIFKSYNAMGLDVPANGKDMTMLGKHVYQILVDPIDGDMVYAATEEGVFRTIDGGDTWEDFSAGLDTTQVRTIDMTADGTLICGTLGYEVYYYDQWQKRWRQMRAFSNFGTFWPIWNNRPLYQYTTVLFHPTDPNLIYAGTFPAGIFRSNDGGESWSESNIGWTNDGVFSLIFHPQNTSIIYAGTYNGVSRSTDGGFHWEIWDQGWPGEQWVFSIDFDPRNPDVMYACSKNGENEGEGRRGFRGTVMKSIDGGANWHPITAGLNVDQEFYKIIVDKFDPDTLYLATQNDGVFISRDNGANWMLWNEGLVSPMAGTNGNNVANPMAESEDGNYLYFGSAGSGVFRRYKGP